MPLLWPDTNFEPSPPTTKPRHNMHDHNETRYHYRKNAEKLARKRQTRQALAWLAVWLFAATAVLLSII